MNQRTAHTRQRFRFLSIALIAALVVMCLANFFWWRNLADRKTMWEHRLAQSKAAHMLFSAFIGRYKPDIVDSFYHSGTYQVTGDDKYSFRGIQYMHRVQITLTEGANGEIGGYSVKYIAVDFLSHGV